MCRLRRFRQSIAQQGFHETAHSSLDRGFCRVVRGRAGLPALRRTVKNEQAGSISPAKAVRIAKTTWPELEQGQIDALTAKLGSIAKVPVTIVCVEEAKCGDLALNLENAFESAHWQVVSITSPMVPAGVIASSKDLVDMLNAFAPQIEAKLDTAPNAGPGDYIAIGARP